MIGFNMKFQSLRYIFVNLQLYLLKISFFGDGTCDFELLGIRTMQMYFL